jgi:NADH dehydrogenase
MQQGRFVAERIVRAGTKRAPMRFHYWDKGSLAVIGRNAAVASVGPWKLRGFLAWMVWMFVHLLYLVEFEDRMVVLTRWAWSYFTWNRGARLITTDAAETKPALKTA